VAESQCAQQCLIDAGFATEREQRAITSVETVYRLHQEHGPDHLRQVLSVVGQTWGQMNVALNEPVLRGVSMVLRADPGRLDIARLTQQCRERTPKSLTKLGRNIVDSRCSADKALAYGLLQSYNSLYGLRVAIRGCKCGSRPGDPGYSSRRTGCA
jgi:hypothetical protein